MHAKVFTVVVRHLEVRSHDARIVHALLPIMLERVRTADLTAERVPLVTGSSIDSPEIAMQHRSADA